MRVQVAEGLGPRKIGKLASARARVRRFLHLGSRPLNKNLLEFCGGVDPLLHQETVHGRHGSHESLFA